MESHLRRIDLMVGSVVYVSMNTNYRESTKDTRLHSLFNTFAYSRDVLLRNSTTNYGRLKLVSLLCVSIHRLKFNFTMSVLSTSTRLFCIFAVYISRFGNGLFVSNLRCTYISLYLELTKQTVNDDLQMKLTHTSDDCLTSFLICMSTECRILFCKFCKSLTHLTLSSLGLRLDCELDNRLRELHGL